MDKIGIFLVKLMGASGHFSKSMGVIKSLNQPNDAPWYDHNML